MRVQPISRYRGLMKSMNKIRLAFSILALPLGVFLFVYGGHDDSPGAQLLGLVVAVAGIAGLVMKRSRGIS